MKKPLMVGAALALVVAGAVGVKLRSEKPADPNACVAPNCYSNGAGGGVNTRLFPEPMQ
jgi:hypothetical protein